MSGMTCSTSPSQLDQLDEYSYYNAMKWKTILRKAFGGDGGGIHIFIANSLNINIDAR